MLDFFSGPGSYLGIVVFLILTGCGLPIPEEVAIIAAGVLSSQGHFEPLPAFLACLFGAIAGDCVVYFIGYHWGHGLLKNHRLFAHLLHAEREEKYEHLIRRHGLKVLLAARFMVGVRSPVYLSAGILRLPFRRFFLMDLLCATVVVGSFFLISYIFGEQIARSLRSFEITLTAIVVLAVSIVLGVLFWRRRKQRLAQCAGEGEAEASFASDHEHSANPPETKEAGDEHKKEVA